MHVTALHLHPIKSCRRVEVERATLGPFGLVGDREWQVVGGDLFITQRTHPKLTQVRPALTEGGVVLRAEGMSDLEVARPTAADRVAPTHTGEVAAGDGGDDAAEWFTRFLGEPARLVGMAPGFERSFPPLFDDDQMSFTDGAQLLVVNDASHRFLAERAVELFGIERFRANIVIDADQPWVEDTWRSIRIGAADLRCRHPWPRCTMPQVDQDTGERHREPALVLKQHRWCASLPDAPPIVQAVMCGNALFGVTASADQPGSEIAVGDLVEVLTTGEALLPM